MTVLLQITLALLYTALAHLASLWQDDRWALAALVVLVVFLWAAPLGQRRVWAWASLPLALAGCWLLYRVGHAMLPLLVVPVVFVLLVAWVFGRSLLHGRTPLITRIVSAIERQPLESLDPALLRYTRTLTAAWAIALAVLATFNLVLALLASPGGLLSSAGIVPPWPITPEQWSWLANLLNWSLLGGFFLIEFVIRKRKFPGRHGSFLDFLRGLAGLGPTFWRELLG